MNDDGMEIRGVMLIKVVTCINKLPTLIFVDKMSSVQY